MPVGLEHGDNRVLDLLDLIIERYQPVYRVLTTAIRMSPLKEQKPLCGSANLREIQGLHHWAELVKEYPRDEWDGRNMPQIAIKQRSR